MTMNVNVPAAPSRDAAVPGAGNATPPARPTDAQRAQFDCEIDRHRAALDGGSTSKGAARASARAFEALTRAGAAIGMSVGDVRTAIADRKRAWATGQPDAFCRAQPQARGGEPTSLLGGLARPEGARVRMADA